YPSLALKATEQIQDVPDTPTSGGNTSVQGTFVRRSRPEVAVEGKYTLFSGLREYSGLAASKATVRQRSFEYDRAKQGLYAELATAFYLTISRAKEIELLEASIKILNDRIRELSNFERLGKSRPSERVSVEADRERAQADTKQLEGELNALKYLMGFYLGVETLPPLEEGSVDPVTAPTLQECVDDVTKRPDIEALRASVERYKKEVRFYKGGYAPTLDFIGRYYPYRVGFVEDIDWDLEFVLNFPFFEGGQTRAEVKGALARVRQSELTLQETERKAKYEVQSKHALLLAALERYSALLKSTELNEKNYKLQSKEYRLGLVTNLDVLKVLEQFYQTRRDLENTRLRTKQLLAELNAARGKIPAETP
ncbi:MAG TPA: TolC family protein, partial [Bdellovibrionota bacterium]|nr:TolC family protein [Bdellovibrionota bacterium]